MRLFFGASALCLGLVALHLDAQEMRPDFRKLAAVAIYPAAAEFARSNGIPIEGLEALSEGEQFKPGDSLTGLITLSQKGGRTTQWLLCITAAEPTTEEKGRAPKPLMVWYLGGGDKVEFSQAVAPVSLRLVGPFPNPAGKGRAPKVEDQTARISVNQGFLAIGLDEAAAATERMTTNHLHGGFRASTKPFTESEIVKSRKAMAGLNLSLKEQRAIVGAGLALNSYTELVQETPGLDELFYKVVKPPSLWSVVTHLGVQVSIDLQQPYVTPTDPTRWKLLPGTRCYTYPLALRVNKQPALTTTLVVAPPRPPLLGCAGIVGMLAENPKEKETYLLLQIISARVHK